MTDLITGYKVSISVPACTPGGSQWGALAEVENDISAVLPYLNAVWDGCRYDRANRVLLRDDGDQKYALRPREIRAASVRDLADARRIIGEVVAEVNRVWRERDGIVPDDREKEFPSALALYKLLPGTNCKQCGYSTCLAFAADLSRGKARPEQCLPLAKGNTATLAELRRLTANC